MIRRGERERDPVPLTAAVLRRSPTGPTCPAGLCASAASGEARPAPLETLSAVRASGRVEGCCLETSASTEKTHCDESGRRSGPVSAGTERLCEESRGWRLPTGARRRAAPLLFVRSGSQLRCRRRCSSCLRKSDRPAISSPRGSPDASGEPHGVRRDSPLARSTAAAKR